MKRTKESTQQAIQLINDFGLVGPEFITKRINAADKIQLIAQSLPSERIKNQLIPFIRTQIVNDDAPVVLALLQHIDMLGQAMGGGIAYSFLLPLMEDFIEYQQEKVRKKAILKYHEIIKKLETPKFEMHIMMSLKKVYNNEYEETKEAFCYVVSKQISSFNPTNQQQILGYYIQLVESNILSHRKYAAIFCCDLIGILPNCQVQVLKIIDILFKDKQESNKIYLIDAIIQLSKHQPPAKLQQYFNFISYQFTWRIRYELISKLSPLANNMGKDNFTKCFLTYYIKYINDIEPEVRSIANLKLQDIVNIIEPQDVLTKIIPAIKNITQDTHAYVRNSLATSILHLCPIIGKKSTLEHILPKYLLLLKDQQEQVKQSIFKKTYLLCQTLGIDTLSQSIIPILGDMIVHTNWRTRIESLEILGYLIKNSNPEFLGEKNITIIMDYMKDRAFAVRKQAIAGLMVVIIQKHGAVWFQKNIFTRLLPMLKSQTYQHRQTLLIALEKLTPHFSLQFLTKTVYSNIFSLVNDPVSNVRISLCNSFRALFEYLPKEKQSIKKLLKNMKEDSDRDVRDSAEKNIKKIEGKKL